MKLRYEKEDDVLMIWFSKDRVDHADQTGDIIMHFSKNNTPVLMEILNATKFLKETSSVFPKFFRTRAFT